MPILPFESLNNHHKPASPHNSCADYSPDCQHSGCPEHWASTIQSIVSASTFGIAPLIASPLGGEIYDRFGPKTIFLCGSLCVGAAAIILLTAIMKGLLTDVSSTATTDF